MLGLKGIGKEMKLQDMYPAVLTLVLVAVLIGVGLTILGNLSTSSGISTDASTKVNESVTAIGNFVTWFSIIIVVIAAGIIIGIVIKSFSGRG